MITLADRHHAKLSALLSKIVPQEDVESATTLLECLLTSGASNEAIALALRVVRARYAPTDNGCFITSVRNDDELQWEIYDHRGVRQGYRPSRDTAADFAKSLWGNDA
jgi:hypothetical protein